jgi:hypothetical protein
LFSFGIGGGTIIGCRSIGVVASVLRLGGETGFAKRNVGVGEGIDENLIGGPIGVVADLLARRASPVIGFFFPALTFLEPLLQPELDLTGGYSGKYFDHGSRNASDGGLCVLQ